MGQAFTSSHQRLSQALSGGSSSSSSQQQKPPPQAGLRRPDPTPLTHLLSRIYNKPVQLNLVRLAHPHSDPHLLAQVISTQLKDRKRAALRVIRNTVRSIPLPSSTQQRLLALPAPPVRFLKPARSAILRTLRRRVSSVRIEIHGRLTRRMTANRSLKKVAWKGMTTKGPSGVVLGWRKSKVEKSLVSGKRRIGAFGARVQIGHV